MNAKKKFLTLLLLGFAAIANASNISINTVPKVDIQTGDQWATITFDISWDNSWRTSKPNNHDAAWIFVKCWDGEKWNHVYLGKDTIFSGTGIIVGSGSDYQAGNTNATGYYVCNKDSTVVNCAMELELGFSQVQYRWGSVEQSEPRKQGVVGVFLRRAVLGEGNINVKDVILPWKFVNQGFTADDDLVVKVFAVEMVFVATGNFYLGAGQGSTAANSVGSFVTGTGTLGTPFQVTNTGPISVANSAGALWSIATTHIETGTVPATFPNGYAGFYIMKYELTQGAFADFLNTLTEAQANGNIHNGPIAGINVNQIVSVNWNDGTARLNNSNVFQRRSAIILKTKFPTPVFGVDGDQNGTPDQNGTAIQTSPTQPATIQNNDGQNVAMIYAPFSFMCSYADWAGLRPMTELEYEKACRGGQEAKQDEFAWGTASISEWQMARTNVLNNWAAPDWRTGYNLATHADGRFKNIALANEKAGDATINSAYSLGIQTIEASNNGVWWMNYGSWWITTCGTWSGTRTWVSQKYYYPEPVRVGMLADGGTNRQGAGASYWGVMNMSDNAREPVVNATKQIVRANFKGTHGDGQLQANGMSNVGNNDWQIFTSNAMTAYVTTGYIMYNRGIKYKDYNFGTNQTAVGSTWWYSGASNYSTCWGGRNHWGCFGVTRPATTTYGAVGNYQNVANSRDHTMGRVASRAEAANSYAISTVTDMFQGIRCVRSSRISNQSTPTVGINNVTQ